MIRIQDFAAVDDVRKDFQLLLIKCSFDAKVQALCLIQPSDKSSFIILIELILLTPFWSECFYLTPIALIHFKVKNSEFV